MDKREDQLHQVVRVAELAARLMLGNGGETYRAEETAQHICRAFGYESDAIAFPTGLMLSVGGEKSVISRVPRRQVDFMKIDRVNAISRELSAGTLALDEAEGMLRALSSADGAHSIKRGLIAGGSSAMFAVMFGGSAFDLVAAGAGAFVTQAVVSRLSEDAGPTLVSLVGGFLAAIMALVITSVFAIGDVNRIILSALMPLLPGLAMTNAIRDAMRGDLVSGVAGAGEALIRAVVLAAGAGLAISAWMMGGGA
ncbi:MAG: threonine/serine exporter family protein [Christensenellales bacterium]|jgi:uncharacterized membrane protein YjjP (DUF1212 family)